MSSKSDLTNLREYADRMGNSVAATAISYALVIHRRLSSVDEASSDEEQRDKILYYFPENTPLYSQLTQANMLEGLIEFSSKFSDKPIQSVSMDKTTWVFSKFEDDFWIIVGANNLIPVNGSFGDGAIDGGASSSRRFSRGLSASDGGESSPSGHKSSLFDGHNCHRPFDQGLLECLNRLYRMYISFHPKVNTFLSGANDNGWQKIDKIQELRKKIRKLGNALKQHYLDKRSLGERLEAEELRRARADLNTNANNADDADNAEVNDQGDSSVTSNNDGNNEDRDVVSSENVLIEDEQEVEQLGIRVGNKTIEDIDGEINEVKRQISEMQRELDAQLVDYPVRTLRDSLSRYMRWFILSGECYNSSGLNGMSGIGFINAGNNAVGSLLRVQQIIDENSKGICRGSMVLYDGNVCWSDLDDDTTYNLYEFVRIQEMKTLRQSLIAELAVVNEYRSQHQNSNKGVSQGSNLDLSFLKDWVESIKSKCGFISRSWESRDFDEYILSPLSTAGAVSSASLASASASSSTKVDGSNRRYDDGEDDVVGTTRLLKKSKEHESNIEEAISYLTDLNNFDDDDSEGSSSDESDDESRGVNDSDVTQDSLSTCLEVFCPKVYLSSSNSLCSDNLCDLLMNSKINGGTSGNGCKQDTDYSKSINGQSLSGNAPDFGTDLGLPISLQEPVIPVEITHALENDNSIGSVNAVESPNNGQICIGRVLLYRQDRMILALLLDDWEESSGPNFFSSADEKATSEVSDTDGSKLSSKNLQMYGSVTPCLNIDGPSDTRRPATASNANTNSSKRDALFPPTNVNYAEFRLLKFCSLIQKSVKMEMHKLQVYIEEGAAAADLAAQSASAQGDSTGSSSSQSTDSDASKANSNRSKQVNPLVRLLYLNRSNRAIVAKHVYKFKTDPLIFWPYSISHKRISSSMQSVFRSVALDVRPRFPHSGALISCCIKPKILNAIGDIYDNLIREASIGKVSELCLRVSTGPRGGVWVIGRLIEDRVVLMILEKCATLNDVFELYTQTLDGFLGQVML